MTKKERGVMAVQVLPYSPGCFPFKNMLVLPSPTRFVRAIYFAGSQDKSSFYVHPVVFPPYLPATIFGLTFGIRLTGKWTNDMPDLYKVLGARIESEALPFLQNFQTYDAFVEFLNPIRSDRALEAKYATLVAKEDCSAALTAIEDLHASVVVQTDWQEEIVKQASEMKAKIFQGSDESQKLLLEWENFTVLNLKLSFLSRAPTPLV